jgi:ATP-dependent Lon protease
MKKILGASIGSDVHVAGLLNFLELAKNEGYETVNLGAAVPISRVIESIEKEKPTIVALSYRLGAVALSNLLDEFARGIEKIGVGDKIDFIFGGTTETSEIAAQSGIFKKIFDGSEEEEDVVLFLRGQMKYREKQDYPDSLPERIAFKHPYPLIRHHIGLQTIEETIVEIRKLADSELLDIISLAPDQNCQQYFFEPHKMHPAQDGAGGAPIRSRADFLELYWASRTGNYPLIRCYSGTNRIVEFSKLLKETANNAWAAIPLFWYSELDRRSERNLLDAITENMEGIKWNAAHDVPVEINDAHQWELRYAHDGLAVAVTYLAAYVAKKLGVRWYIQQYMMNTPPGLSPKMDIQMKTREDLNQQQKEYYLQQQLKTIQEELGGNVQQIEIDEFRKKAKEKKWSKEVAEIFEKEVKKLERLNPQSPDYSVQYGYVQTIVELPWNEYTQDNFDLKNAQKILDRDHFGMEKVKERIIEHLAVLKLKGDMKSPILCLYGPPGVGKTSLGKSIAEALNRKYVRVSLGGLHDEAEIRGHRRTYIGAIPGRIIQNIQKAGSSNPVFVLDEIDKIGSDFRGDPASALLEVLDPEQNSAFHDNYLSIDYDLSKVLFIATANNLNTIPAPLLDRMELINVGGYITEEKIEIASRHLLPKELDNHGIPRDAFNIPKKTLEIIIENYTRESGVRELEKQIAKILRKIARKIADNQEYPKELQVDDLKEYLGVEPYTKESYQGNEYAGVVTGLAWTAVGGEILFVESSLSRGKGSKLTITGNLGDVMKESAMLAMEYIRSHAEELDIDPEVFENWNTHIHVPEGAIPKDGPSAGITMITSLASAYTQRKVKANLAMTGEITLRGKVLPVGGIKEKILAAKRAGIKEIILSAENKKDVEEIKPSYLKGLKFHYVDDVKEVLDIALLKQKVKNPKNFTVKKEKTKTQINN